MEIFYAIVLVAAIFTFFYFYGKFLGSLSIKSAIKKIEKGNLTDKKLLNLYKNSGASMASVFLILGGPFVYFKMKKAYVSINEIYKQELIKRKIDFA